jgi:hypothetical protein
VKEQTRNSRSYQELSKVLRFAHAEVFHAEHSTVFLERLMQLKTLATDPPEVITKKLQFSRYLSRVLTPQLSQMTLDQLITCFTAMAHLPSVHNSHAWHVMPPLLMAKCSEFNPKQLSAVLSACAVAALRDDYPLQALVAQLKSRDLTQWQAEEVTRTLLALAELRLSGCEQLFDAFGDRFKQIMQEKEAASSPRAGECCCGVGLR